VSHLTPDELARWRNQGAEADRSRVVRHLAECDTCGAAYAELVRSRSLEEQAPAGAARDPIETLEPAALRPHGYAALRRPIAPTAWLAAAASVAVAALGAGLYMSGTSRDAERAPASAVRGSELVILAPVGATSGPVEFRWSSPVAAPAYRVDVFDSAGQLVHSIRTAEEVARDPGLPERLRPGARYTVVVTALAADGRVLLSSAPQPFVFASPP
jgi:hypothetical protein